MGKHNSGYAMHNSVGIILAFHKCFILSVHICSTIGKHILACNRHEVVFLLQFSTGQRCLLVYLLHSTGISLAYGYHCDPSVRHLIIHTLDLVRKLYTYTIEENNQMKQVVYTFSGKKIHQKFCCN